MDNADLESAHDLLAFVNASPTPFHASATAATRLDAAGFTSVDEHAGQAFDTGVTPRDLRPTITAASA